ncbi:hypothetical protein TNCV_1489991 [Trichonephila clavipes]|nr:hypothetical protein TNCV_1489991 [Trichonephila clavipes]
MQMELNLAERGPILLQLKRFSLTLNNADAEVRSKLNAPPVKKHFITELNGNHVNSTILARLRTRDENIP